MMDFHLATPNGDVYLFSYEDGRVVVAALPGRDISGLSNQTNVCRQMPLDSRAEQGAAVPEASHK